MSNGRLTEQDLAPHLTQKINNTAAQAQDLETRSEELTTQLAQVATQKVDKNEVSTLVANKAEKSDVNATNLRIDNLVIPISPENANVEVTDAHVSVIKNKAFPTLRSRLEEIEGVLYFPATNLVTNGGFSAGTSSWLTNDSTISVAGDELTMNATARYGGARNNITNPANFSDHILYVAAEIKADNANVGLILIYTGGNKIKYVSKFSEYERLAFTVPIPSSNVALSVKIQDNNISSFSTVKARRIMAVDLTAVFGRGNEPTVEQMDAYLKQFPNNWFDNTTQISNFKSLAIDSLKVIDNIPQLWKPVSMLSKGNYPKVDNNLKKLIFDASPFNTILYVGSKSYLSAIPTSGLEIDLSPATGTSAWTILLNLTTEKFELKRYDEVANFNKTHALFATFRIVSGKYHFHMPSPFYVDGKLYGIDYLTETEAEMLIGDALIRATVVQNPLNANVKAVAHRGYSDVAPENTLSAYQLAKQKGINYVECDVAFTSDAVPVLLHDSTINRTARNLDGSAISETKYIYNITFSEARAYEYGSWKSSVYRGEKIPTFEEFILLCKKLNLHPYIELKNLVTIDRTKILVNIVKKLGMINNVTWISNINQSLINVTIDAPGSRLGLVGNLTQNLINDALILKTHSDKVFVNVNYTTVTKELSETVLMNNLSLEVWTVNNSTLVNGLIEKGVSGIATDLLNIAEIINS